MRAHRLWVGVSEKRYVSNHLLISHLILLGDLDHAVEHQHAAVRAGLEDQDILRSTQECTDSQGTACVRPLAPDGGWRRRGERRT